MLNYQHRGRDRKFRNRGHMMCKFPVMPKIIEFCESCNRKFKWEGEVM